MTAAKSTVAAGPPRWHPAEPVAAADPAAAEATAPDPQAAVLRLLLQATTALARAGQADRACRLAAAAWATLREPRPDLASTVTAALHGLTRHLDSVPVQAAAADPGDDLDPDLRNPPTARRHE